MKLPAKDSSEDHRQSPLTPPISKSEPTIAEPTDNSLSPTISKSRLSRQPCKNDFVIGKKLGKGKFGDVHLAKHKHLGFACAIKIIPKSMLKDEQLQNQIIRELKIQCFLHHFNIASMYGYFNDEESVYFLLELCCDGQLYNIIKERKRIPEIEAKYLILQICCAAEYLHRQRVIHRDLKL
jgi:aurora kinase